MKRILTFLMAVILCAGLLPGAVFAAGDLPFIDVSPEAWYYGDVKTAVDAGLVNGKSATTYCPDDLLTYAEAVKLAACMHQKNETGTVSLVNGDPWYQSYADYAKMKGIIAKDYDWSAKATRAGYMAIFAHALPDASLAAKNEVPDGSIPDVPANYPEAPEIYKLYRAGILQGSDDNYNGAWTKHLCKPGDNIKRSEVAAILTRMMFVDKRISFSMAAEGTDALKITKQPADASAKVGTAEKAVFTVAVSGGKSPYTYQWYTKYKDTDEVKLKDNELNSGTTTATLTLTGIRAMDDGSLYWCVITDAAGAKVTSSAAKLTLSADSLKITKQPQSAALKAVDDKVAFTVEISGGKAPYNYKWYIEKETGSNFQQVDSEKKTSTYNVTFSKDSFTFTKYIRVYVEVTDAAGAKVTSEKAEVKPFTEPTAGLKITKQPENQEGKLNDPVKFTIGVTGGVAPYTYEWQYWLEPFNTWDEIDFKGAYQVLDDGSLVILVGTIPEYGEADFIRCVVTDSAGMQVISKQVHYTDTTKTEALKITKDLPSSYTLQKDEPSASFTLTISGGKPPYSYYWELSLGGGGKGDTYKLNTTSSAYNTGYLLDSFAYVDFVEVTCFVTDSLGNTAKSNTVSIYPYEEETAPLKITKQPKNYQMVTAKDNEVTFTVDVSGGKAPYRYQWYEVFDRSTYAASVVETNNTSSTYLIDDAWISFENSDKITVYCVITDANGTKVETGHVEVLQYTGTTSGMRITQDPDNYWMKSSQDDVSFTVKVAGGSAPYTYEWYYGRPGGYTLFDSTFTNYDSDTVTVTFSDNDFEDLQATYIDVYCVVTDDWGAVATSKICYVYQY